MRFFIRTSLFLNSAAQWAIEPMREMLAQAVLRGGGRSVKVKSAGATIYDILDDIPRATRKRSGVGGNEELP
jgi:hypothetical protein